MLGSIDYFTTFAKLYTKDKCIPEDVGIYFDAQLEKVVRKLNKLLKRKNWLNGKQLKKIISDIDKTQWKAKDEQHRRLVKFYRSEIEKIMDFSQNGKYVFRDVESDIHEFRRKLRWLSIYAQSLQGCVELVDIEHEKSELRNYLTDTILESPFNRLPPVEKQTHPLALSKFGFYAVSWMIEQLGILKDHGLSLLALADALKETEKIKKQSDAIIRAEKYLEKSIPSIDVVLSEANKVSKQFFMDKILKNLLK